MSDPFLAELWRTAPPPWNRLGPEIAVALHSDAARPGAGKRARWSRQLREARASKGLTQLQVGEKTGLSRRSICATENCHVGKEASTWATLSAFYGITLE